MADTWFICTASPSHSQ